MTSTARPLRVLGYTRVSTDEQHDAGAGLPAQVARLTAEATVRGWDLEMVTEDGGRSGSTMDRRDALADALARLDRGEADALAVTKVDRLSRSVGDFAAVMDRARSHGWQLVALDLGVDTGTPSGELVATLVATVSQYERRLIGQRTREALAQRRAEGVRLGRPSLLPAEVVARIVAERAEGRSLRAIAAGLVADGVPTAHGGATWHAATVRAVLGGQDAARLGAA